MPHCNTAGITISQPGSLKQPLGQQGQAVGGMHGLHGAQEHGTMMRQGGLRHFMDPNYYSMPGYPLNPPVFRAGLAWHFYK